MSGNPDDSEHMRRETGAIYVLGNHDGDRTSLQALLAGHFQGVVRGFRSEEAFLEEADQLGPGALLIDGSMSAADEAELLGAIGRFGDKFAAIVLSGAAAIERAVAAMKAGAADYLAKPCPPGALVAAVDAALSCLDRHHHAAATQKVARTNIARLSGREAEVLKGLIDGRPNKDIAQALSLSPRTVEIYRANVMEKLGARSLSDALRIAFTAGLFPEG